MFIYKVNQLFLKFKKSFNLMNIKNILNAQSWPIKEN